jgi:hypothetical protein
LLVLRNRKSSIGPVLGLLLGATIQLSAPRTARAHSGEDSFLETIGISIVGGTVLGASTLPFYDQPGKHLENLAYGAAAGAAIGLGLGIYGWFSGSSNDDAEEASLQNKLNATRSRRLALAPPVPPTALVWTPIVSLTW